MANATCIRSANGEPKTGVNLAADQKSFRDLTANPQERRARQYKPVEWPR
jgi:hypothetical protein